MVNEKRVYDILKHLRSTDKLRELFSYLNYNYANRPISTRTWSDRAKEGLRQANIIAEHDGFHIIYCTVDCLLRGVERSIVTQILKEHPYSLIVFSDPSYQDWHFVNVKWDEEEKNRRLFRRIVVGPDEKLHTAAERVSILEIEQDDLSVLELQMKHDEAFDVETVTKEFFNTFVDMFHLLREEIETRNSRYRDKAGQESQLLLDRLMFLYFIQKKGWLDNNKGYLYERFDEYYESNPEGDNFYKEFLIRLFQALSSEGLMFKELD